MDDVEVIVNICIFNFQPKIRHDYFKSKTMSRYHTDTYSTASEILLFKEFDHICHWLRNSPNKQRHFGWWEASPCMQSSSGMIVCVSSCVNVATWTDNTIYINTYVEKWVSRKSWHFCQFLYSSLNGDSDGDTGMKPFTYCFMYWIIDSHSFGWTTR